MPENKFEVLLESKANLYKGSHSGITRNISLRKSDHGKYFVVDEQRGGSKDEQIVEVEVDPQVNLSMTLAVKVNEKEYYYIGPLSEEIITQTKTLLLAI